MEDKRDLFIIILLSVAVAAAVVFITSYCGVISSHEKKQHKEFDDFKIDFSNEVSDLKSEVEVLKEENSVLVLEAEELYSLIQNLEEQNFQNTELKDVLMLSEDEINLLSRLVKCEAGNEPFECKVLVCVVVFNRMYDSHFKNTLSDVIYSSGQFTPAETGSLETATTTDDTDFAVKMALSLTYNEINELYGTDLMFFRAATQEKTFGVNKEYAFTVGKTDFYRLTK